MSVNSAFISLGSNIKPAHYLPAAIQELNQIGSVISVSRVWESKPVGDLDQDNFMNAAVLLKTSLTASDLKNSTLRTIEDKLDRRRDPNNKNAARTIDLDLALFNRDILELDDRSIPDPDILMRPFVALPLAELDPDYIHPVAKCTLSEIADSFNLEDWAMTEHSEIILEPQRFNLPSRQ